MIEPETYMSSINTHLLTGLVIIGLLWSKKDNIWDCSYSLRDKFWRYIFYSPGYGMIRTKKNKKLRTRELYIATEMGNIIYPTLNVTSLEGLEIFIFDKAEDNQPSDKGKYILKFEDFLILEIIHTKQRKENKISGFISSYESEVCHFFTVENDFINYDKLIEDYKRLL